jgi:hypothetical protein
MTFSDTCRSIAVVLAIPNTNIFNGISYITIIISTNIFIIIFYFGMFHR